MEGSRIAAVKAGFPIAQSGCRVSMRARGMAAVVRVFQRERAVPADAVVREPQQVLIEKSRQGVTVTGR